MKECTKLLRHVVILPAAMLAAVSAFSLGLPARSHAQPVIQDLLSIPRRGTELMKVDPNTGETISSLAINLPDGLECDLRGGNGLATDPLTEELFALLNCGPNGPRLLAIIDTFNGNAAIIGETSDFFAGLAFFSDGTLFAVTGNGANVPNTLFTLDPTDATASPVCQLPEQPPQAGGQAIAFNPHDELLFHASGNEEQGGTKIFESIDDLLPLDPLEPCPVTPRGPSGDEYIEATAMTFSGSFLLADLGDTDQGNLYHISDEGVATLIGLMDHVSKGLAFVSGPAEVCYKVKKDGVKGPKESVFIEDSIVGPRPVVVKLKKARMICVPGGIRFTTLTTVTPDDNETARQEDDPIVKGKICYRVKDDDSGAAKKTNLEVEDEGKGERLVRIKTRKAFVVCDQALIDTSALPF